MTAGQHPFAVAAATFSALALVSPPAVAGGEIGPGAYCPFPKEGETPACLEPAKGRYGEFFQALDSGEISDEQASRLEQDVAAGAASETPYLAISSLSYGYYRLAVRAAAEPGEDPVVVARLERWNRLLAQAYESSPDDPSFRDAVREAALDLQERAPRVSLTCVDAHGATTECSSTEAVLRGFNRASDQVGIKGALRRLIERLTGGGGA